MSKANFASIVAKGKVTRKKADITESASLIESITSGMSEIKAHDIVVMDLREIGYAMADYFVVCHGNSNTQVHAIAQSVEKESQRLCNEKPLHVEGKQNAKWILMDYINVVVHIFDKDARSFYALEELWADAKTSRIAD